MSANELYSRVALLGRAMDGVWNLLRSLPRALTVREPDWLFATSKRSYVFDAGRDAELARYRWLEHDAAVLVVSARLSITDEIRRDLCELRARSSCPIVAYIAHCDAPDSLADLAEIEARELLDRAGYDADDVEFVRAYDFVRTWDDEAARSLAALLDERARIAPALDEGPLLATVVSDGGPLIGSAEVSLVRGVLREGPVGTAFGSMLSIVKVVSTSMTVLYPISAMMTAYCESSDPIATEQLLYERASLEPVTEVRAVAFSERVRDGLVAALVPEWCGGLVGARVDDVTPDLCFAGAALVTLTLSEPVIAPRGLCFYWDNRSEFGIVRDAIA